MENYVKAFRYVWCTQWRCWLRHCATNRKVAGSISDGVIVIFLLTYNFRSHYDPGVGSASNRNEYQEHLLRDKCGRCLGLTALPSSRTDCLEICVPQSSGTLRVCLDQYRGCFACYSVHWCMCDRASYMKMTRGTNLMKQLWFIIINISACFGHLYAHLQEYRLCAAAYGVQHCKR